MRVGGLLLGALAALPAQAAPPLGCFARTYSDAHLGAHPDQIVRDMRLRIRPDPNSDGYLGDLWVTLARQGHVRAEGLGGRTLRQYLVCWSDGSANYCGVECDGGTMEITRDDGRSLAFTTDRLMIGNPEDCGGSTDLAEHPDTPVTYLLTRADDSACPAD